MTVCKETVLLNGTLRGEGRPEDVSSESNKE